MADTGIRKHMQDEHDTPYPITHSLTEEQLEEWDAELHDPNRQWE